MKGRKGGNKIKNRSVSYYKRIPSFQTLSQENTSRLNTFTNFLAKITFILVGEDILFRKLFSKPFSGPHRSRTFKCLWGPGIDSKERIPPAYVAWRAGTITLFLLGS
jgi:hypothetical protein